MEILRLIIMNVRKTQNPYPITVTDSKTGRKEKVFFSLRIVAKSKYIEEVGGCGSVLILHGFDGLPLPVTCVEDMGDSGDCEVDLGSSYSFIGTSQFNPQYSLSSTESPEMEDIKASLSACHKWLHRATEAANNGDLENAKYWMTTARNRLLPYNQKS